MQMNQKGKGQDNFQTPGFLFQHLNAMFDFQIDAACDSDNCLIKKGGIQHGFVYDQDCDGLNESWENYRVFCNPPYSQKEAWIKKAHDEVLYGDCPVCVMILPTLSMTTEAWHTYIHGKFFYQFSPSRYSFIDPVTGKPRDGNQSGTTVVYFIKPLPKQPSRRGKK